MIYDTDSPPTGGTADCPDYDTRYAVTLAASLDGTDLAWNHERAMLHAENHAELMHFLGARMQGLTVQWWPLAWRGPRPAAVARKPYGIWAGLRDGTRGRHWDRKRR